MDKGTKVYLEEAKVYPTYDSKISSKVITGDYYIYNDKERNNRIRVTDDKDKVDLPCSMTGWVDLTDIHVVDEV